MDTVSAARQTLALARQHEMDWKTSDKVEADYMHLESMYERMTASSGEMFSETKMAQWLGWMQACVYCMCDNVTLDDMKQINERCAQ